MGLNGSERLYFTPVGKQNLVEITSPWPDPSFEGAFLPVQHQIKPDGFQAKWEISHLGRNYPQSWDSTNQPTIEFFKSNFGVNLLLLTDFYQKSERSVKYGILFILLTFTTFFLFEVLNPVRVHPLQYLMVGFALCLFYVLLISISEHLGFQSAYWLASGSTITLITFYAISVLGNLVRSGILGLALTGLYIYLFILLHLQDYALLFGALGLFFILALVMYITRDIDWYAVGNVSANE